MKEEKCENENFNNRLFSEVANKGDKVWLYGKRWYVMKVDHGIVKLISKDWAGRMVRDFEEESKKFCCRLHELSQEYVGEISKDRELVHTRVRSCQKGDLNKYLNRKVEWGDLMPYGVCYPGYAYWLASLNSSDSNNVWRVNSCGYVSRGNSTVFGVRPVVYLRSDVCTIGKDENGVWILKEE